MRYPKSFGGIRGQVREHGVGRDVLGEGGGVDLVEGVVRGVVQVEVVGAVLAERGPRDAEVAERPDVGAGAAFAGRVHDAERGERLGDARVGGCGFRGARTGVGVDAARAEIAFGRELVQRDLVGVRGGVALRAGQAVLLVGERHHPDRARRRARQVADQLAGGHGDADAGAVVDRAGAEVPGIQVPPDQHDFFRSLAARDLADHVVRGRGAVPADVERDAHADRLAQCQQAGELVGIGDGQCRRGDRREAFLVARAAGVRVAVRVGAGGAHQVTDRAGADRGGGAARTHLRAGAVAAAVARARHLVIDERDPARQRTGRRRLQRCEVGEADDPALDRAARAAAQRRDHQRLCVRAQDLGAFAAAHPARERHGLGPHLVVAQRVELGLGPGDGAGVGLAAAGAWADFGRQRFDDAVTEVAGERRLAQLCRRVLRLGSGGEQERCKQWQGDGTRRGDRHGIPQRLSESRISRSSRISSEGAAGAASAGLFIRL